MSIRRLPHITPHPRVARSVARADLDRILAPVPARGATTEGEPADLVGAINSSMQQAISSMQQLRASVGQSGHDHGHRGAHG